MISASQRIPYETWRGDGHRVEDAARVFGYHLIKHCREEALRSIAKDAPPSTRAVAKKAVDQALHNVMDLLEGFWKLDAGKRNSIALSLSVEVHRGADVLETIPISPCIADLPIGYWAWVEDFGSPLEGEV